MGTFKQTALDYFVGGVPTGNFFQMTLADIKSISNADKSEVVGINRLQELCLMGALSYFEAFCKDHFAATINIAPSLIRNLKIGGQDVTVDASHVAMYGTQTLSRIGFVLASKFDFGTPQKINALFRSLLKITPFSKRTQYSLRSSYRTGTFWFITAEYLRFHS